MNIENISNAFLKIKTKNHTIITDPWLSQGIFDNSWVPFPPVYESQNALRDVTHCFISHIHADHYDPKLLGVLPKTLKVIIPSNFPNAKMKLTLQELGFSNIISLNFSTPTLIESDMRFELVPAMNDFGQETNDFENGEEIELGSIDTGLIIEADNGKIVLLADNSPYNLKAAGNCIERMRKCDLIAVPYNGYADDFPISYLNWDLKKRQEKIGKMQVLGFMFIRI